MVYEAFPLSHAAGMSGLLLLTPLMPGIRLIEAGALTTLVLVAVTAREALARCKIVLANRFRRELSQTKDTKAQANDAQCEPDSA